jgi:hypothetical protein
LIPISPLPDEAIAPVGLPPPSPFGLGIALGELSIGAVAAALDSGDFASSCCCIAESAGAVLLTGAFEGAVSGFTGSLLGTGRGGAFGFGSVAGLGAWFSEIGVSRSCTEK